MKNTNLLKINIEAVLWNSHGYQINWTVENDVKKIFNVIPIHVSYETDIDQNPIYPVMVFLSTTLGPSIYEYPYVEINLPYKLSDSIYNYWIHTMQVMAERLNIPFPSLNITYSTEQIINHNLNQNNKSNIGLLFGGGVESSFALSQIHYLNPILISIVGEQWMNNDVRGTSIKTDLENALIQNENIKFQRIEMNIRKVFQDHGDEYVNRLVTGYIFYTLSFPLCSKFNIHQIWKCSELEEALILEYTYDYSIKPTTAIDISLKLDNTPLFMNVFNGISKPIMLKELSKTPFFKYMYSCSKNSEKRWCGKCSKCYRISAYCDTFDIDKSIIGLQDNVRIKKRKKGVIHLYWKMLRNIEKLNAPAKKWFF